MCVLFGCSLKSENAPEIVGNALLNASFVEHDSSGLAAVLEGQLAIEKDVKPVEELLASLNLGELKAKACIGHLRWATHGAPRRDNAHPLLDCRGRLAIVHNGVVENFASIREELASSGHSFVSKTDSEVLAHLIGEKLASGLGLVKAVARALEEAEGSIAMALVSLDEPEAVVCACKSSRLFLGLGSAGSFCSSELACLHGLVDRYAELGDGELAILRPDGVEVTKLKGLEPMTKEFKPLGLSLEAARRLGHEHMVLREIWEQVHGLSNTLRLQRHYLNQMASLLANSDEIFMVGEGSSYNACLAASYLFSSIAYQAAHAARLAEFARHYGETLGVATTVLLVDSKGDGPELRQVVELARRKGATVLGITNKLGSFLTRMARVYVCQHSGPPLGVISMRDFTAQVLVLAQLAIRIAEFRGKVGHVELEEYNEALASVPSLIEKTIRLSAPAAREAARKYVGRRFFFVLGRGIGYPTALEGVQKLMEIASVASLSYPAGESKHGPISLVEEGFPVIFICQRDETHETIIGNIMEMRARGARVIAVAEEDDEEVRELSHDLLPVPPETPAFLTPIVYAVPLQLMAYYSALARGINPDIKASRA